MENNIKRTRPCELYGCLKHILRLCRWVGHFPIENLQNPRTMRFHLKSVYTVYYVFSFVILTFNTIFIVYSYYFTPKTGPVFNLSSKLMISLSGVLVTILMYRLAKCWPSIVEEAADIEESISGIVQVPNWTRKKCAILTYTVIVLGFVDHILYSNYILQVNILDSEHKVLDLQGFDNFLKDHFETLFWYLPFNRWFGIVGEYLTLQVTFLWNVADILGMCFSAYITSYFQELGKIIHSDKPKDWGEIRACYSRLAILLNRINDQLSPFTFISSLFNLFFICMQLFSSLRFIFIQDLDQNLPGFDNFDESLLRISYFIYHVFSFMFLIVRSMTFAYMATNVHTSANNAVAPLYAVSSSEYNDEVKCFQMQLRYNTVGLDGVFYYVERQTILRVIAAIVTYELVLLQFGLPKKLENSTYATNFTTDLSYFLI